MNCLVICVILASIKDISGYSGQQLESSQCVTEVKCNLSVQFMIEKCQKTKNENQI